MGKTEGDCLNKITDNFCQDIRRIDRDLNQLLVECMCTADAINRMLEKEGKM